MRGYTLRPINCLVGCFILLVSVSIAAAQINRQDVEGALQSALKGTPAVAVILNLSDGRLLSAVRPQEAAMLRAAPGSLLKPLFLASAIEGHEVDPHTEVFCHRDLHIAGRNLACTHPQTNISFQAEDALAYSCNTYFADLARHLTPAQATATLQQFGLTRTTHLFRVEADPVVRLPNNMPQLQLLVLGLDGVMVTPAQVAFAYRNLMNKLSDPQSTLLLEPVKLGLRNSVRYGMAHNADVAGMEILGKTGTAIDSGQAWTHGWFAGSASIPGGHVVIAIYSPRGNGADAAHLAQLFFIGCKMAAEHR